MRDDNKTGWRHFFVFASIGIAILLIVSLLVLYFIVQDAMRTRTHTNMVRIAELEKQVHAEEMDAWFNRAYTTVNSLANTLSALSTPQERRGPGLRDQDDRDRDFLEILTAIVNENDYIINAFIGFSDDSIINGSGITPGRNWRATGTRWYREATEAGEGVIVVTDPYFSHGNNALTAAIAIYLPNLNGVGAVVGVSIVEERILDRVAYNLDLGGYRLLVTNTGHIVHHAVSNADSETDTRSLNPDGIDPFTLSNMPGDVGDYLMCRMQNPSEVSTTFYDPVLGESYIVVAPLEVVGWTLFEIIPTATIEETVAEKLGDVMLPVAVSLLVLAVFSLSMLFVTFVSTRRTIRSANAIKAAIEIERAVTIRENKMHEKIRLLHKTMPEAYVLLDDEYKVIECNRAAIDMFMVKRDNNGAEELLTTKTGWNPRCMQVCKDCPEEKTDNCSGYRYFMKNYRYIYPDYDLNKEEIEKEIENHADISVQSIAKSSTHQFECKYITFLGREVACEVTVHPINIHGAVNYVFYMRDMRSEKRREEAEQENRAKTRFLARMSHEIRTPINAVRGITEIQLQQDNQPPAIEEAFLRIYNSSNLLLAIINDILDMAKVEAGEMHIIPEMYSTVGLIMDVVQLNLLHKKSNKIEFKLNVDSNLPANMIGDELRIKQIINNLLSNAFKYTEGGLVTISFGLARGHDNSLDLMITVADTGQGLMPEQINAMFENDYTRFNEQVNHRIEGSGLGTSIIYQLVQMMDGEITVESTPDVGSTFTVRIPQEENDSDVLGKEATDRLESLHFSKATLKRGVHLDKSQMNMSYGRVLVVDDVEANIYVAKGLLQLYKLNIDTAESGSEAVALIDGGNVYDIIFMDHMMPVMDGIETAKVIRDMGYTHPIVALTANAIKGAEDLFIKNGFDGFISKPIDLKELNEYLINFVRNKQTAEVLAEAEAEAQQHEDIDSEDVQISGLYEAFTRGSIKFLDAIEALMEKNQWGEDSIKSYVIYTHGLKGALLNIGRVSLAEKAATLEQAGRNKDLASINKFTHDFATSLRDLIAKLLPQTENNSEESEDPSDLAQQLRIISEACTNLDISLADSTLDALKRKPCSKKTREKLENISELILRGAFEEAANVAVEGL